MRLWRFLDYYEQGSEVPPIREWLEAMPPAVQATFDVAISVLEKTEDWSDSESFGVFTRKPQHLGMAQVKFEYIFQIPGQKQTKRQYRAIGLWREEAREFVLLTGFEKSGNATIPPNAFELAIRLRTELEEGKGEIREHI